MSKTLFILNDPPYGTERSYNGLRLAIALIFGILVSTLLTLVVIPVLYYIAYRRQHEAN